MHFELSDEQIALQALAEKYAQNTLEALQQEDDNEGIFRREIVEEMGDLGFWGSLTPEEYGGTNFGFFSTILMIEKTAAISPAYTGNFMTQNGSSLPILKYGTDKQKQKYLPALATADILSCFAVTEPDAGTDIVSMKMIARENGDSFIINGTKNWITNAPVADIGLIFAFTDRSKKHKGISCFIVELKNNEKIKTAAIDKLGLRCSKVGELYFDNAKIPKNALLGKKGQGYEILMYLLGNTRLFAAGRALGLGQACLTQCIEYAKTREQFGQPIGKFQMIQEQIAEMYIMHEASRALVYQAALNKDAGLDNIADVACAKYYACEAAVKAADIAMKIFGAYSYSMEYPIQRLLRDSRAFVITEGSSNIQKMIIARELLGL